LRPASNRARQAMHQLRGFTSVANPLVSDLPAFSRATGGLVCPLQALLREFNPLQHYLVHYQRDWSVLLRGMRWRTDDYDALGHHARTQVLYDRKTLAGGFTAQQEQAYQGLLATGALSETDTLGANPYPGPGGAGKHAAFAGSYQRVHPDPPYTRCNH